MQKTNRTSSNLAEEKLIELYRILPEAFAENKVDFDKLRAVLGDSIQTGSEKFSFSWAGKSNAIKNVLVPSKLTLNPKPEESIKWDESENLFIEGDNLEVLKLLQKAYFEKVKMIYIDPPYNTAHVFDFDKLNGKLVTRYATDGEELELLDGKKVKLTSDDYVIADEKHALSLAGIKGGKLAEVDKNTKVAVFEMANFNPTMIRKTSQTLGIRTDASKIFENGITTNKTQEALGLLLATLKEIDKNCEIEFIVNKKFQDKSPKWVETTFESISNFAGKEIGSEKIVELLKLQNFQVEVMGEKIKVLASSERLDINIAEDVSEEVLRLYGFDNLESTPLNLPKTTQHSNMFLLENYLRVKLFERGYTEIFNYTFVSEGEIKLKAGLAEDKMFLRKNLEEGMKISFTKNYNYLPIVEKNEVKTFEIGSVFGQAGEFRNCVINFDDNRKKSKYLETIQNHLNDIVSSLDSTLDFSSLSILNKNEKPALLEFSLNDLLAKIEEKNTTIPFLKIEKELQSINYKPISIYPFIVRDVATFVPVSYIGFDNLKSELLKLNLQNVEKVYKFDEFTKTLEDGSKKTSIAFRIIFQSYDKTLTDQEIENEMQKVVSFLQATKFEIR
jgi:phenylalanyl-tRNA synthetase beta subunit